MITSLVALGLVVLGVVTNQWTLGWIGVLLAITLSLGAYVIWIRYRRLWFRLYLGRERPSIPDTSPQEIVAEESKFGRQYVRARCNAWRGARRAWLWTLPWGIRVKPRGGQQIDVRWSDMVGASPISMNMLRTSDLEYVRIRTRAGLTLLLAAREIRDWRASLLGALRTNGVTVSVD
jgi:hypothetical protein